MPEAIKLGKLVKIQGKEGEMVCHFETDNPERFSNLEFIHVEINRRLIPFRVYSMEMTGNYARISLQDVNSPEAAKELIKREVYFSHADLPQLPEKELFTQEIIGYRVYDQDKNEIGQVMDILNKQEQSLLVVLHQGKELLIPLATELILEVGKEEKIIVIDLPEGLIELNS